MAIVKTLQLKDEILALEERKAKMRSECEVLEKELTEKRESLGEVLKRLAVAEPDYKEIEQERLQEVDSYMGKSVSLREEIDKGEDRLRSIATESNNLTNNIEKNKESLKKSTLQLTAFTKEKEKVSNQLNTLKRKFEATEKDEKAILKRLTSEIRQARESLRLVENETIHKKSEIERESRVLGLKQRDLDIYASRMHKKYPSENFTLMDEPLVAR